MSKTTATQKPRTASGACSGKDAATAANAPIANKNVTPASSTELPKDAGGIRIHKTTNSVSRAYQETTPSKGTAAALTTAGRIAATGGKESGKPTNPQPEFATPNAALALQPSKRE